MMIKTLKSIQLGETNEEQLMDLIDEKIEKGEYKKIEDEDIVDKPLNTLLDKVIKMFFISPIINYREGILYTWSSFVYNCLKDDFPKLAKAYISSSGRELNGEKFSTDVLEKFKYDVLYELGITETDINKIIGHDYTFKNNGKIEYIKIKDELKRFLLFIKDESKGRRSRRCYPEYNHKRRQPDKDRRCIDPFRKKESKRRQETDIYNNIKQTMLHILVNIGDQCRKEYECKCNFILDESISLPNIGEKIEPYGIITDIVHDYSFGGDSVKVFVK